MNRERRGKAQRLMVEIVSEHESGIHATEVIAELERRLPPEPGEVGQYDWGAGRSKYATQVLFASIGLAKAGWVRKARGTWSVTEEGRSALKQYPNWSDFQAEMYRLYKLWKNSTAEATESDDEELVDASSTIALESAEEQSAADIQKHLGQMPPNMFEKLIEHLLKAMGYYVPYRTTGGADGGIDIVAYEDPLGAKGARIKVQAKRHQSTIGRPVIQELLGSLAEGETGLIVALSGFSKDAEQFARAHQTRRITLMDGPQLVELWVRYYEQIPEDGRLLLRLTPVYFLHKE
jgi:restriction system protein